ncbi:hypothetical protein GCM10008957_46900 [Deinococcus ruber]|uniref:Lipoprotein n=1 Tax=Deinococcus ruber TaxID=1848197 RepID=A0A918FCK0_9DEIO|nr:hypothetical protein GCM10008957_46900 [Deinococcus ruber]
MRLLPVFFGLTLLLTACPQYQPVQVPMDDPNILNGQWTGTVVQHRQSKALASVNNRLYVQDGNILEVYDAASGIRLSTASLPAATAYGLDSVGYRDDGVIIALGDDKIYKYDALTLGLRSTQAYPINNTYIDWRLSNDAKTAFYRQDKRLSTENGTELQTVMLPNHLFKVSGSSDDQWWVVTADQASFRVVRSTDGSGFDAAPQHPPVSGCPATTSSVTLEHLRLSNNEERLLLTYPDGVLETRDLTGHVVTTLVLSPCEAADVKTLAGQADQVSYALPHESGLLDVKDGKILQRHTSQSLANVVSSGSLEQTSAASSALSDRFRDPAAQPIFTFTPWNSPVWTLPNLSHRLSLDVQAKRTSADSADVTGDALLDGRTLTVSGKLGGVQAELQAQGLPFTPFLDASLNFFDGTTNVASADFNNRLTPISVTPPAYSKTATPQYFVDWNEAGVSRMVGLVTRP